MEKLEKLEIYEKLKKNDIVEIEYNSAFGGYRKSKFLVSKGKTQVGKRKVERIILKNIANLKGVKYYLYQENGIVSLAIGNLSRTFKNITNLT